MTSGPCIRTGVASSACMVQARDSKPASLSTTPTQIEKGWNSKKIVCSGRRIAFATRLRHSLHTGPFALTLSSRHSGKSNFWSMSSEHRPYGSGYTNTRQRPNHGSVKTATWDAWAEIDFPHASPPSPEIRGAAHCCERAGLVLVAFFISSRRPVAPARKLAVFEPTASPPATAQRSDLRSRVPA